MLSNAYAALRLSARPKSLSVTSMFALTFRARVVPFSVSWSLTVFLFAVTRGLRIHPFR